MIQLLKSDKCRDVVRTASNSRILKDALSKEYPLRILKSVVEKFYLGDAGFMLKPRILTPYREKELKGNRHDSSWTTEAYATVVKTLSIAIDLFYHLSGFAWNPVTRKFEAEEEVWQDFIKRHVESAERQAFVAERQVSVAKKQVSLIERQVAITEKGLAIMQQSRPRLYSESDVWDMLTELGLVGSYRMQCYQFLCENEQKKCQIFGIPPEMRLDALFYFMTTVGICLEDMVLSKNIYHYRNHNT
ncbi:hypothetical protein HN51_059699 [Arachis hypogaea]